MRLQAAGFSLKRSIDAGVFAARPAEHVHRVEAVAEHLGTPRARLLPQVEPGN